MFYCSPENMCYTLYVIRLNIGEFMANEKRASTITISFSEDQVQVHRDFKSKCAQQGKSMNNVLIEMLKEYIKKG